MAAPGFHEGASLGAKAHGRPIRVAHVGELAVVSASGVDRTVAGLVTHLGRCGIEPEVWHLSPNNGSVSERPAGPVTVFELPADGRAKSAAFGLPEATRRFIRERAPDIDLLHLHSVFIPDNVSVARLAGVPYVLTPNGGYSPEVLHGRNRVAKAAWMRIRERSYVRGAELIHAVSPRELDQLRATFGTDSVLFVPNAIEIPREPGSATARRTPRNWIVFLGRLAVEHKGLDTLLEGFARFMKARSGTDFELILAGPDFRSGRAKLEALAGTLLPSGTVSFPGPVFGLDKEELLRSASVFVHTSRWEGMPFAVLEALAVGVPVLLTPATNLGEFVEEFGAGVVVEGTAEGVHRGLQAILEAPPQRYEAMCSGGRRLVTERFTWPRVAGQMAAAYRGILA